MRCNLFIVKKRGGKKRLFPSKLDSDDLRYNFRNEPKFLHDSNHVDIPTFYIEKIT